MANVGRVVTLWRYPVKGMRGEELPRGFLSFAGLYGDRMYAFRSPAAPAGFPYHTAREQEDLLLYQPRFRTPDLTIQPPNLPEAEAMAPGITPVHAGPEAFALDVVGPNGQSVPIDSSNLHEDVRQSRDHGETVSLVYSERPMTDCRPLSVFNLATARQLDKELGLTLDLRRFRANLYIELEEGLGFAEDTLVGQRLEVGDKAVIYVLDRDPRCKMIGLDPETGDHDPRILQHVAAAHEGKAGVYAAVLAEGVVRPGDTIRV